MVSSTNSRSLFFLFLASTGLVQAKGPTPSSSSSKSSAQALVTSHTTTASSSTHTETKLLTANHQHEPVSYSGSGITGAAALPPSISTALFPTNSASPLFPNLLSGILGQSSLDQSITNGLSQLGTFGAATFPPFLGSWFSNSDTTGAPWGGLTAQGTNPYTSAPVTGVVRSYHFNIARAVLAPDGVQRNMLVVNGQFPGPTIEANWGDTIQVTVTNNIQGPAEGTSIHWHGLLQHHTGYEDGVPGITQCPIAPGQSFTYSFQADLYGTSWWHSHFSAQYAGGVIGAMIIHGPQTAPYDHDLGPVLLTDYYHDDYYSILEEVMGTDLSKIAVFSQNNLINGKGNYNCSLITDGTPCTPNAGLAKFRFVSGQSYRLRLINAGAEGIQRFSIDGHSLQVIANDFVPIVPYTTDVVTLGIGQRTDVVVKANGSSTSSYWMRSTISSQCSLADQPNALAIVYYQNANTNAQPNSTAWPINDSTCGNDDLSKTTPLFPITPPAASATVDVAISFEINATGHFLWTVDGSTFRTDYNDPILPLVQANNATSNIAAFPREWNVYNFGSNSSYIIVVNNPTFVAHPMHIHGHNMFILSQGQGSWDGTIQGNKANPQRRDVQLVQPFGYIAIQVIADNPGIWPFHCHIAWHVSGGLYMNILERPADIPSSVKSPASVNNLCTQWSAWTSRDVVDQIDSGLKVRGDDLVEGSSPAVRSARYRRHVHQHMAEHIRHKI